MKLKKQDEIFKECTFSPRKSYDENSKYKSQY